MKVTLYHASSPNQVLRTMNPTNATNSCYPSFLACHMSLIFNTWGSYLGQYLWKGTCSFSGAWPGSRSKFELTYVCGSELLTWWDHSLPKPNAQKYLWSGKCSQEATYLSWTFDSWSSWFKVAKAGLSIEEASLHNHLNEQNNLGGIHLRLQFQF